MDSTRGELLVASPALVDPNFARSVVLIGEHSAEGALGVILNRPAGVEVADAAPVLAGLAEPGTEVFSGGPVGRDRLIVVADFLDLEAAGTTVLGNVGLPRSGLDLERLPAAISRARVFAGYAGWGPGQLEGEIESGDWVRVAGVPDDVFSESPELLWTEVLERAGGRTALLARMPPDPSLN